MKTTHLVLLICACCLGLTTICYSAAQMARKEDGTAHGGVVATGSATVLIGGKPAARATVDTTLCPMVNPGTPPTPHVGGTIMVGSPTVLINGAPAARVGSPVADNGGTDQIITGCPTVLCGP